GRIPFIGERLNDDSIAPDFSGAMIGVGSFSLFLFVLFYDFSEASCIDLLSFVEQSLKISLIRNAYSNSRCLFAIYNGERISHRGVDLKFIVFDGNDVSEFPCKTQVRSVDVKMLAGRYPDVLRGGRDLFHPDVKTLPYCFQIEALDRPSVFNDVD